MTTTKRYRSPGRKEMAALCAGKRYREPVYAMRGKVPSAVEEDKEFFQLFQLSKKLEHVLSELRGETIPDVAAIRAAQDVFNSSLNRVRARWLELVPEDRPS